MNVKKCSYNGQLFIKLEDKRFTFYSEKPSKQPSILYDVSNDEFEELELAIEMKVEKSKMFIVSVLKLDYLMNLTEILKITLDSLSFSLDLLGRGLRKYEKTVQIFGEYVLTYVDGLFEVDFSYDNCCVSTVLTLPEVPIYEVLRWLLGIWPTFKCSTEYCLCFEDCIIDEQQTLVKFVEKSKICVKVAEKCYVSPITEDDSPILMPWNIHTDILRQHLTNLLSVASGSLILLDRKKRIIPDHEQLNINDHKGSELNSAPLLFYDITGSKIRCVSMRETESVLEVMVIKEETASKIKQRLGFKTGVDARRFALCSDNSLLLDSDMVTAGKELKYCVGLSFEGITSKKIIGKGGFGIVYKCTLSPSNDAFALKEFIFRSTNETKCSIIREYNSFFSLTTHVNIIQYLDIYIHNDKLAISMEYMERGSLGDYLVKNRPLNEKEIRGFSIDILRGLNHLHCNEICHRDIKADNVLLGKNKVAKICDFGLSKCLTENTDSGEYGTHRWMAPEVIMKDKYTFKADIWSFGATVVQMITGHVPYHQFEDVAAIYRIINTKSIEFTRPASISDNLQQFVVCCLQPEPVDRPPVDCLLLHPFLYD